MEKKVAPLLRDSCFKVALSMQSFTIVKSLHIEPILKQAKLFDKKRARFH